MLPSLKRLLSSNMTRHTGLANYKIWDEHTISCEVSDDLSSFDSFPTSIVISPNGVRHIGPLESHMIVKNWVEDERGIVREIRLRLSL